LRRELVGEAPVVEVTTIGVPGPCPRIFVENLLVEKIIVREKKVKVEVEAEVQGEVTEAMEGRGAVTEAIEVQEEVTEATGVHEVQEMVPREGEEMVPRDMRSFVD